MAVQFRGTLLPYDFVSEWRDLAEGGIIRPDAYIMIQKDREGRLAVMEGGHLQDAEDIMEINAVIAALVGFRARGSDFDRKEAASAARAAGAGDFGLSPQQLQKVGEQIPPDHSAIIILFENLWERRFREIVTKYKGELIVQKAILPEDLEQLGRDLAEAGKKGKGRKKS
jgi:hypothetical protein